MNIKMSIDIHASLAFVSSGVNVLFNAKNMLFVLLLVFFNKINGLPNGAPTSACQSMHPFHGGGLSKQLTPSPFEVFGIPSELGYIVSIKSATEVPFEGVMLQARLPNGNTGGTFEPLNNIVHTIDCQQPGDTITHNKPVPTSLLEVRWIPPAGYEGPVIFNSTVAQDYSTFWVGVQSRSLQISSDVQNNHDHHSHNQPSLSSTSPHYTPEDTPKPAEKSDPFYEGCSINKLCFGVPDNCVENENCKAVTAITVKGSQYEFEMKATGNPAWVGVGLSDDQLMGDDSVIECVKSGNSVKSYLSWTDPRPKLDVNRIRNSQQGIELKTFSAADGVLYCRVVRDAKTSINGRNFDLVNNKYNILIAAGTQVQQSKVAFHDIGYLASSDSRFLSDISNVAGASKLLIRLHGAFMLAAWIGTASLGTFIARYYRKTWVGKTLWGKDLWFAWHRNFMVLTWTLTTVAFALIFVELKAWSSENNPHAILGCIVTAICFVQPVAAFFRPHPGTSKRPIFNWLHWLGGNCAHIIAIITIFFAAKLNKAELPIWFDWIMVAFVIFHVAMHLILSILSCISENSSNKRITSFPMKDLNTPGKLSTHMVNMDSPHSTLRKLLLGLYVIVTIALVVVLIVIIVLAPIQIT